mmetsp:Transcript_237/g.477  ORF Transcript_237/g.477 Transcript_237/m.477 type:complete len:315 (-) Transcript_237:101-1045(-)
MYAPVGVVRGQHLEARSLQVLVNHVPGNQRGQPVAHLDALLDPHVVLVGRVVLGQNHPLVAGEERALLEHAVDAAEGLYAVGGVAGGLDLVRGVEVLVRPGQGLEVSLGELAEVREAVVLVILVADVHLVLVDGDALHGGARERRDVAHRPAHAAAHVQHLHARHQTEAGGEVVLCALEGLHEGLVLPAGAEVEALPPAPLVEVRYQVVEMVDHVGVLSLAHLDRLLGGDGARRVARARKHALVVLDRGLELLTLNGVVRVVQELRDGDAALVVVSVSRHGGLAHNEHRGGQRDDRGDTHGQGVLLRELGGLLD